MTPAVNTLPPEATQSPTPSVKRLLARNATWNVAGMLVSTVAGFLIAPALIHRLGDQQYGLWILIASLTSYFGSLDLGTRAAVGRYLAYYSGRNDTAGVQRILATAMAILLVVAIVAFGGIAMVAAGLLDTFNVPAGHTAMAQVVLIIVGIDLALGFFLKVCDAALWAAQRFDLINLVDIAATILRASLTLAIVRGPNSLVILAAITLGTTILTQSWKVLFAFRLYPYVQLSHSTLKWSAAKEIVAYGFWSFVNSLAYMATTSMMPVIAAAFVSVAAITPLSLASRLVAYAASAMVAVTGVLTPLAARLTGREHLRSQQQMFITGSRLCFGAGVMFSILLTVLGDELLVLWVGPGFGEAAVLLNILAVGALLPMSQYVTRNLLMGMGLHRPNALARLAEAVTAVVGAVMSVHYWGIRGICLSVAVASTVGAGPFSIVYTCRQLSVPLGMYIKLTVAPVFFASVIPAVVLWSINRVWPATTWLQLVGYAGLYCAAHLGANNHQVGAAVLKGVVARYKSRGAENIDSAATPL